MLGAAGQMNYAASNAALDSAIAAQRNRGFASVSAQWGAWSGGGMADRTILDRALRMGIGSLSPEIGLEALAYILAVMSADAAGRRAAQRCSFMAHGSLGVTALYTQYVAVRRGSEACV